MRGACSPAAGSAARCTTLDEAAAAVAEGADFLLVGNVYPTDSHPGRPAAGLGLVRQTARARAAR